MDATEILDQLARAEGLPSAALQAASAQRAEMTPVFLAEVEAYLAREPADHAKPTLLFFVFHLLGEWREKAAYRLLARLLRCPGDEVDAILGDAVTATAHRVIAAVFDGDPQPLYDIVLDADADEFVRSAICDTLAVLVLCGGARPRVRLPISPRCLYGAAAASAMLCLAGLAKRHLGSRPERA
jgi:hypothetical protein